MVAIIRSTMALGLSCRSNGKVWRVTERISAMNVSDELLEHLLTELKAWPHLLEAVRAMRSDAESLAEVNGGDVERVLKTVAWCHPPTNQKPNALCLTLMFQIPPSHRRDRRQEQMAASESC
ncbi:hypothetical protein ACJ41P_24470 [Azospirillum argentinense]|uniref:Uncharacterized protein n=1 Tax=Azospirillum argentinense TaxID=2970906 RepID=A0ABW8VIL8_9PROT